MIDEFDDDWSDIDGEIDEEVAFAELLVANVLRKTRRMTFDQWWRVASAVELFGDDPEKLGELLPDASRVNRRNLAYVYDQFVRHQHSLTEDDLKRTFSERQLSRLRRSGGSVK